MSREFFSANPRIEVRLPVSIKWKSKEGFECRAFTFSHDVSFGGIGVLLAPRRLDASFQIGQEVLVSINDGEISAVAKVRHVTSKNSLTYVGLEFPNLLFDSYSLFRDSNHDMLGEIFPTKLPHPERRHK
ncbi:MAG: PilZ domain-containing protein [Acidobacteriota bacterium]